MLPADTGDLISRLMSAFREGDQDAGTALTDLLYPELKRLAAARMRGERAQHTWQPTALVHELYLELRKVRNLNEAGGAEDRAAFLGLAGHMMKRMLIHHARPLHRRVQRVEISAQAEAGDKPQALQEVEDALRRLAEVDPRLRTVVEMKVFEGFTGDEIARELGCSRGTVSNCWAFAQQWLREEWAGDRHS
jgi:RNA polymerase sigma factor (TIGR02999 family)